MKEFLESLSREQINMLLDIINNDLEGDNDFFLYCIEEELKRRNTPK